MTTGHVVVVGGGISGLTAAWELSRAGLQVTVLEQRPHTGGVVRRARVAALDPSGEPEPGWPMLDQGAEALLARRPEALDLIDDLGLTTQRCTPETTTALIASRGRLHPMPTGTHQGVPADPATLAGLLTEQEVARAAAEPDEANPPVTAPDASVADVVGQRLGPAVVDRLVEPLLGGVYAGRVDRLSLAATIPTLWGAARTGRGLAATVRDLQAATPAAGPVFTGLVGGVSRLAETLTVRLQERGAQVWTGACVQDLERAGRGWRVRLGPAGRGPLLGADAVLVAVPAPPTARLLAPHAPDPDALSALGRVRLASMALVSAVLPAGTLDGLTGSGVLVPAVEHRLVKAMTFSSRKWGWVAAEAGGRDVLRLSVGRVGQEEVLQRPDSDLTAAALADAADLLGRPLPALATRVQRWGGSLPQYDVGHDALVEAARDQIARVARLEVAGSVWGGIGIPACIATARSGAHALAADLGR